MNDPIFPRPSVGTAALAVIFVLTTLTLTGCGGNDEGKTATTDSSAGTNDGEAGDAASGNDGRDEDGEATGSDVLGRTSDGHGAGDSNSGDAPTGDANPADSGSTGNEPLNPCDAQAKGRIKSVRIPLGETLFFAGDDYLAFWGKDLACAVQLMDKPVGAQAAILLDGNRLTPDKPGKWRLQRGKDKITIEVKADYWTSDTFQNFNYSPSSPIAAEPTLNGKTIAWVATPTSCAVQQVELSDAGAKNLKLVPTGAWPSAVVLWPGTKFALVAQTGRDTLGFLNRSTGVLEDAMWVGNEPANIIVDQSSGNPAKFAYVALSGEDRVAKIDLNKRVVVATVEVGRDPRAMVLDSVAGTLYVASLISSNQHPRGPRQIKDKKTGESYPVSEYMQRDIAAIDTATWKRTGWAREVGTILRGLFLQSASKATATTPAQTQRLLVAATLAKNTDLKVDADTRPHRHRLIVLDPTKFSTAEPGKALTAVTKSIDLDKQPQSAGAAASPFSMAITPDKGYLVVSLSASHALLFLDPVSFAERGRQATGHDPRGLIFAHGRIWTYAWLSDTLEGLPLPGPATQVLVSSGKKGTGTKTVWKMGALGTASPVKLIVGADPTPKEVRAGQRIFNDATFSKFGEFSCNNCHVDGLADGLTWDLLIDGPVNTLAFRNVGGTDPFLWGGQLPTLFDFSREVLKLVGAEASGKQMEQLTRYMMSVTAPPNPYTLPGGKLTKAAMAGRVLFTTLVEDGGGACAGCHGGPLGTSGITVKGKTPNELTDVPSLLGAYDTSPYGREGQWATLAEMVEFALTFTKATLSAKGLSQLTAYVEQLPGDLLTLNSATPANNAKYVWKGLPIALVFSQVLAPGQESKFTMTTGKPGATKTLPGTWKTSGRYARFTPSEPLKGDTMYGMKVSAGLEGAFGQRLPSLLLLRFETGGTPAFDVSGKWKLTLKNPTIGAIGVNVALIMAKGGKLTGVVLDSFKDGNVGADAVAGVVSGKILALEPFYVDSDFGKFFIKDGIKSDMKDSTKDGFADKGTGAFTFKFGPTIYPIAVSWKRLALPKKTP